MDPIPPEAFLDAYAEPIRSLAEGLRNVVRGALPEAVERVRIGWRIIGFDVPVGRRLVYFCWVMPEPVHVHLGFRFGVLMGDPAHVLHGDAKLARWVTLRPGDRIDAPLLRPLVLEGARVAGLSPSERTAVAIDRELSARER